MTIFHVRIIVPALAVAACMATSLPAIAQTSRSYNNAVRSRYNTPYMRAYGAYGYGGYGGYRGSAYPLPTPRPSLPPVTGPIEKYSPVEYGQIVKMAMDAARARSPMGMGRTTQTQLVDIATSKTPSGETIYAPVATKVSQVLDRGILLLPTGEEIRLRGVFMPSTTDTNDVLRLYAKEGMQVLSTLTAGKDVYVLLDEPLRGDSGRLLGTVLLADGTELNRRMLELGYGSMKGEDFAPGVDYSDLTKAQATAKEKRLGIWSR